MFVKGLFLLKIQEKSCSYVTQQQISKETSMSIFISIRAQKSYIDKRKK